MQLDRIARRLRRRVDRAAETSDRETEADRPFGAPGVDARAFRRAMSFKSELQATFDGRALDDLYDTDVLEGEHGSCLEIRHREPIAVSWPTASESRTQLQRSLRLMHGVGPRVEAGLRESGYTSLGELTAHPRWSAEAERVLDRIDTGQLSEVQPLVRRWFPVSHPLNLKALGLGDPQNLVFFDVESLGLFGRPVVLLGLAHLNDDALEVRQLLAREVTEELPALALAAERLGPRPILVTYNGRAFDANLLRERLDYYGVFTDFEPIHVDLLPHARRHFRTTLPDARLETVEGRLGRSRAIDLPSTLVPDFYNTYTETANVGPLVPILEHNKHDMITLVALLTHLLSEQDGGPLETPSADGVQ